MSKYYRITFLFILSTIIVNSQTGKHKFEHLSVEQGLSQSSVLCIYQDSREFLWVGTEDGLNKYDGYKFYVYKNIPNDSISLSDNRVNSICEDKNGFLWIGTHGGGLNRFDRDLERFSRYVNNPSDSTSLSNNFVNSIYEDKSGILWIGTLGGGLNKFNRSENQFTHYFNDPDNPTSLSNDIVHSIYEDNSNVLWIGTWGGLNRFNKSRTQFIHYTHDPTNPKSLGDDRVFSIYEDNSNNLWICTWGGGLDRLNGNSENFTRYQHILGEPNSISNNFVLAVYEDKRGDFWVGTFGGGLDIINVEKNLVMHYTNKSNDLASLSNDRVYRIYEDNTNLIWIGTVGGGLNKVDRTQESFTHYTSDADNLGSLSDKAVFAFCEDKAGLLWVGTYGGGLNRFNRERHHFRHYTHNPKDPNSLSNNGVSSICERESGELWVGTFGGGLNKFDRENEKFIHYFHNDEDPTSLSDNNVSVIYEDKFGLLWVGTLAGGLNRFDDNKNQFIHYTNDPDDTTSLRHNRVYSIIEDKNSVIWVGTFGGGLSKFDREDEKFMHYTHDPNNPFTISNNKVYSIYEDQSGFLWIGTVGGGLNKFDPTNNKFFNYREKDGLANDVIYGILEDDKGNLWLSTNKGLSKFNIKTETFRNYDVRDGLQNNEFNQGAYLKNKKSEMFFGGINGFNIFHPDSIKDNPSVPKIVLTDFQLFNRPVPIGIDTSNNRTILIKSITETKEIELTYEDYVISFEFAALDFHIPEKNKYAYIMEGFDKDWTYTDANRRFVTYTNLDPGEYTLRVKGSNNDGVWNEQGTSLRIIITPPWWATTWAYTLYGFFLILLFISARTYDLKRQRLKHQLKLEHEHAEKLKEVDQMKSRFFTNISHEFRTPLTLISGPSDSIITDTSNEEIKKKAGTIKKNANRLLNLINQLLDLSKLEAGRLKLETSIGNIVTFVRGIAMSFESLAETKDIILKVKSTRDEIELYFDKEKMEKVFTNLLSNAFKFTPEGGKLTISVNEADNNSVEIIIKDTGIGIPENELPKLFDRFYQVDSSYTRERGGTGIGLALTKELVELHRGTIKVGSEEKKWTEVTVSLPLGKEHLLPDQIVEADKPSEERKILVEDEDTLTSLQLEKRPPEGLEKDKNIILVVEDNADVREYIKDSLENEYYIEEAANGEQGLRKAQNIIPDLIISDIMMPKMDGVELTRRLKNDELTSHVPIILLTAKSERESKLEGLETGADAYLTKPFDTKELQIRIKNLINLRRKLQQKFSSDEIVTIKGKEKKLSGLDEKFMKKVTEVIEKHSSEEEFSIEDFGKEVGMSRMQIHRKLKALTGKSATHYIRSVKLFKAKEMLRQHEATISEIAYSLGFSSPSYFTRCFKEEFGYPPSDLVD